MGSKLDGRGLPGLSVTHVNFSGDLNYFDMPLLDGFR